MAVVGDIYTVKIFCRISPLLAPSNVVSLNVLHYRVFTIIGTPKGEQQIADGFDAFWGPRFRTYLPAQASYRGVLTQKVWPLPIALAFDSTNGAGVGAGPVGDLLPPQICGIITKQTLIVGRRNRGRLYMPFPAVSDQTDSVPNVAYLARLSALLTPIISFINIGVDPDITTMEPILFHKTPPGSFNDIVAAVRREYFGTQRRRSYISGADFSPVG